MRIFAVATALFCLSAPMAIAATHQELFPAGRERIWSTPQQQNGYESLRVLACDPQNKILTFLRREGAQTPQTLVYTFQIGVGTRFIYRGKTADTPDFATLLSVNVNEAGICVAIVEVPD